jgi:hypothetical protein
MGRRDTRDAVTPVDFANLRLDSNLERVCHVVVDEANHLRLETGIEALSVGQLTAICVEKFFGEVCNGGL